MKRIHSRYNKGLTRTLALLPMFMLFVDNPGYVTCLCVLSQYKKVRLKFTRFLLASI